MHLKKSFIFGLAIYLFSTAVVIASGDGNFAMSPDGVKISFEKLGTGEPALVFIHGWSNNKTIWEEQVAHFSKKYTVVTLDLAGFGQSGNNRSEWSIPAFAGDVNAVISKLGLQKVVLVGFSMGGPVAVETANANPDPVLGIVLVDNMQDVDMHFSTEMMDQTMAYMMDLVTNPTIEKIKPFCKNNPEESFQKIKATLKGAPGKGWEESLRATLNWSNDNCRQALKKLQVPVVAINSNARPTNIEAFKKLVPSFRAHIVPDVGHVIMWDAPVIFDSLLEESIVEFTGNQ